MMARGNVNPRVMHTRQRARASPQDGSEMISKLLAINLVLAEEVQRQGKLIEKLLLAQPSSSSARSLKETDADEGDVKANHDKPAPPTPPPPQSSPSLSATTPPATAAAVKEVVARGPGEKESRWVSSRPSNQLDAWIQARKKEEENQARVREWLKQQKEGKEEA